MNVGKPRQPEFSVKRSLFEEGSLCRNSPQLPGSRVIAALPPCVRSLLEDPGDSGPRLPPVQDGGRGGGWGLWGSGSWWGGRPWRLTHVCTHTGGVGHVSKCMWICHLDRGLVSGGLTEAWGSSDHQGAENNAGLCRLHNPPPAKTQVVPCGSSREREGLLLCAHVGNSILTVPDAWEGSALQSEYSITRTCLI